jgi:5-methylthioadenosine/S-adenosylhomocysteine deaminase
LLFPPGRYQGAPLLDVLVDRASGADVDTVVVNGQVIIEGGRFVTVDEDALRDRILELTDRLYAAHAPAARWAELAALMLPPAQSIYERWYQVPVESPASVFNTRRAPG